MHTFTSGVIYVSKAEIFSDTSHPKQQAEDAVEARLAIDILYLYIIVLCAACILF